MKRLLYFSIIIIIIVISYNFFKDGEIDPIENSDVILITIETLRADHLQCQGYDRDTAPNICELAEDGVLFENAYATGSETTQSIPVILTGKNPASVSLPMKGDPWGYSLSSDIDTVANVLGRHNFTPYTNEWRANFDQGFESIYAHVSDFYEDVDKVMREEKLFHWWFIIEQAHWPYAPEDEFRKWDNVSLNSSFIWEMAKNKDVLSDDLINDTKILGDVVSSREFIDVIKNVDDIKENEAIKELINLYDADILMADSRIGDYIDKLKQNEKYQDSMIIITSDHGEFLGEKKGNENRRLYGHQGRPYEEVVHVPLIIKFPENEWAGKRIEDDVSLVDLVPTIYDYINVEDTPSTFGDSLIPVIKNAEYENDLIFLDEPDYDYGYRSEVYKYFIENIKDNCLRSESPTGEELFNLKEDPNEKQNILDEEEEIAKELRKKLCDVYLDGLAERKEWVGYDKEEETKNILRKLGYLD